MKCDLNHFLECIKGQARKNPQRVVFPEGFEERILRATETLQKEKTAIPILVGNPQKIKDNSQKLNLKIDFSNLEIQDPETSELTNKYAQRFYKLRKHKNITEEEALKTVKRINYFGTMMVEMGDANGMVSGTTYSTAETVRPALQIIKTKEKFHKVSGMFIMVTDEKLLLFADSAITISPNSHDLANIAIDTAESAKRFGLIPKVAMLSFSTAGSAKHPDVDKVKEAVAIAKTKAPDLIIEGEMQVDAALVPHVCQLKFPESSLKGDANVLVFPNLECGNIAYKLVERLAGAQAIGPILQGLKKPINDLSRGCSYQDIVNLAAITTIEAQELNYNLG